MLSVLVAALLAAPAAASTNNGGAEYQQTTPADEAVAAAQDAIGSPYASGGTTKDGFDCSGLTRWAYRKAGIRLKPNLAFRHPAVRQLMRLSGWTLGYVIANQVTVVVVRNLADPGSGDARAYFTCGPNPHFGIGDSAPTAAALSMSSVRTLDG